MLIYAQINLGAPLTKKRVLKRMFGPILEDFYVFQKYANFGRHQINLRAPLTKKRILKRDVLDLFRKISMFSNNMQILGDTKLSLELC